MVKIEVKITRQKLKGKYKTVRIAIPKVILNSVPIFKTAKKAEIDIDVLGNLIVKPK